MTSEWQEILNESQKKVRYPLEWDLITRRSHRNEGRESYEKKRTGYTRGLGMGGFIVSLYVRRYKWESEKYLG